VVRRRVPGRGLRDTQQALLAIPFLSARKLSQALVKQVFIEIQIDFLYSIERSVY
jgi:hypothetical protein